MWCVLLSRETGRDVFVYCTLLCLLIFSFAPSNNNMNPFFFCTF